MKESISPKHQFLEVPPGYSAHEKPIEYHYNFSSGEKFEAKEQSDGTVKIVIEKDRGIIFDFAQLLPRGYKFVSYPYIAHLEEKVGEEIPWIGWSAMPKWKLIQIGEWESAKDIVGLLHEIGHVINYEKEEQDIKEAGNEHRSFTLKKEEGKYIHDPDLWVLFQEDLAKAISKTERNAWTYSIMLLRRLKRKLKIDFKDIFPDAQSVKDIINDELSTYKKSYEWLIEKDTEFANELRKLFNNKG
ncbi:MAG: hypothetical protein NTX00_03520 [Candidatus Parcubacteria bacterium]|nr:hypothetical protein [Candidatus Parcubacteria bacterium]